MLTAAEIQDALLAGYELRGLELKGPGLRSDSYFFAKVARAALGLGNLRDGGYVIIGINDDDPAALMPGLDDDQLASWLAYDDIARKLAVYADPPLKFDLARRDLSSGAHVAVLQVYEFADIPHLCAKAYEGVLKEGALYCRPRKVPETSEVATAVEMRDILELATEKALRRFVEMAERAGLRLGANQTEPSAKSDEQQYEEERDEGWS